jgi:hypothetical protein
MREKARIQRISALLETIWQQQPDVRFNQLISNLQYMYSAQHGGYGKRKMKEQDFSGKEVDSSYLDIFYLEDTEWEAFLESIVGKEKADLETAKKSVNTEAKGKNGIVDNTIAVIKLILADKTVEQIAETLALSPKNIERIKEDLLEGTTLEQLKQEYALYEKELADKRSRADALNSQLITTDLHKECTHFLIEEDDEEKLSALNFINRKIYRLHYDFEEGDYYVINENGTYCYSIDAIVHVKMLKQVD